MSSESSQPSTKAVSAPLSCTFCDCQLTEQLLALQSYPGAETTLPTAVPDHGGLTLCPGCASEVVELLTSWHRHGQPPVDQDRSIGDGYREIASNCSFCTDSCSEGVLGIELYRRVGDELPAYANYTLCANCQSVFGEFLQNVRGQSE
jgi:NAD-dependent dihydropyrimidine dehydrogenase PreA subunit